MRRLKSRAHPAHKRMRDLRRHYTDRVAQASSGAEVDALVLEYAEAMRPHCLDLDLPEEAERYRLMAVRARG